MIFRAAKAFQYRNGLDQVVTSEPGQLVDILMRKDVDRLLREGAIVERVLPFQVKHGAPCSVQWSRSMRVGIWLRTSRHYSGGRIHMFQYAWNLVNAGAEVFLMTDAVPRWMQDYPTLEKLHVVIDSPPPPDVDLIITDSKEKLGRDALEWKKRNPWCPFVCMNFETPNWVEKFDKSKSARLGGDREIFEKADLLLANSAESMKYLKEWMNADGKDCAVLHPAVNDYGIRAATEQPRPPELFQLGDVPFAVWCARGERYKGADVAFDSVWKTETPLNLVLFGSYCQNIPAKTPLHRVFSLNGLPDRAKFWAMTNARMVLAPSLFEGFGMIPAEATACGTPVVAFDLPVLRKEYSGLPGLHLVKHGDGKAFARKVAALAATPKIVVDPKPVVERLGMDAMARKIERIKYHAVRRPVVSVQLLAYWGFFPEAVESVYEYADEIFIAYGRVKHARKVDDGSLELIRSLPDPDGKIVLEVRDEWSDKREMRSWCSDRSAGNRMLVLDGDEVWVGLEDWIKADVYYGSPRWINLWHGGDLWVHDARIGGSPRWGGPLEGYGSQCPHYRWSFWRRSFSWKKHHTPVDRDDRWLTDRSLEAPKRVPGCAIYHLGHALGAEVMQAKHDFYIARDGDDPGRRKRMAAWHGWDGKPGDCGDGIVEPVTWKLPDVVRRALARIEGVKA